MKRGRKAKLTDADIREIREMYANTTDPIGWSVPQIAKQFKVSTATIHKALNGNYQTQEKDNA